MIECSICMISLLHSLRHLPFYPFILLHTILFECFSLTFILGSNILAKQECIICRKKKTSPKGSGYENLTKCATAESTMAIINYVNSINDSYGKTQLMDYPVAVVIIKEFQYHRTCYRDITQIEKQADDLNKEENETRERCFRLLKEFVTEKIIQRGEVLKMSAIADHYKKLQLSNLLEVKGCINRNLKSRLVTAFGDELSFFQKKEKTAEIVYGSREDITPLSDEEKTNDIAKLIKDEIVPSIKDLKWAPNPETIRDQNIKIPKLLETSLKTLLSRNNRIR